jgi:hypothetical protein
MDGEIDLRNGIVMFDDSSLNVIKPIFNVILK